MSKDNDLEMVLRGNVQSVQDVTNHYRIGSATREWEVFLLDERSKSGISRNRGLFNYVKLTVYDELFLEKMQPGMQVQVTIFVEGIKFYNKKKDREDMFHKIIVTDVKQLNNN